MSDVAAVAGVSSQTVSRVANNRSNVDEATREKVLSAMRLLGYRPNTAARALATGRFGVFGVVGFNIRSHGNVRTMDAIVTAAQAVGYSVSVVTAQANTGQAVRDAVERLTVQAVDGIALIEAQILETPVLQSSFAVPVVVVDGEDDARQPCVDTNQAEGARLATRHLLDLGHRTVRHVAGPEDSYAARRRAESWLATLKAAGAPLLPVLHGDWTAASGYEAGRTLAADPSTTAVFAANDQMALGVLRALHDAGRAVPGEVSVVGFDDIPEAEYLTPPLTTVRQDFDEVGRQCVALLLDQIDTARREGGAAPRNTPATIAPRLVIRGSTAAARTG